MWWLSWGVGSQDEREWRDTGCVLQISSVLAIGWLQEWRKQKNQRWVLEWQWHLWLCEGKPPFALEDIPVLSFFLICLDTLLLPASPRKEEPSHACGWPKGSAALPFSDLHSSFWTLGLGYTLWGGGYIEVLVGRADGAINSCLCYENWWPVARMPCWYLWLVSMKSSRSQKPYCVLFSKGKLKTGSFFPFHFPNI